MKKKLAALLLALLLIVSCVACGKSAASAPKATPAPAASYVAPMPAPAAPPEAEMSYDSSKSSYTDLVRENNLADLAGLGPIEGASSVATSGGGSSIYTHTDAKLIRRASLVLETLEFDTALQELDNLVAHCEGYYGNSDVYSGYNSSTRTGYFTVRIPKDRYDLFLNSVGEVGQVTRRTESTEDVGEQYYNTELRLATLEIKHERILSLLEKAADMETIIALEMTLADIEYEIDYMGSTLRRYDSLIDYATIDLELYEKVKLSPDIGEKETFASRFGRAFGEGFANFGYELQWFAIGLAYNFIGLIGFLVVAIVVIVVVRRVIRKRKAAMVTTVVGEPVSETEKPEE